MKNVIYMDITLLYNKFVCIYIPDYIILLPIRDLYTVYFPVRAGAIGTVGTLLIIWKRGSIPPVTTLGGGCGYIKRRSGATFCV